MRPQPPIGLTLATLALAVPLAAATVPAGFTDTAITTALAAPTAMALAPDGRFFITEQGGDLRIVKQGALLDTPFLHLAVDDDGERGLLGVALDPEFPAEPFVYVYYTVPSSPRHNRVSRFTAQGDVAAPGSEVVLFDLDHLSGATNHNGGALHFGPDGKLYVAVGENANGANAQSLATVLGKILRLNADGSIPADNPFAGSATGKNRAIWAYGLRNPFTFAFSRAGRMFLNDVGQSTWEEIDEGVAGSNYGWPSSEGPTSNPAYRAPLFAYTHDDGCAITGGAFYDPASATFPAGFQGKYFFADLCGNWIRRFDPASKAVTAFATGVEGPVDLLVSPAGDLYYLAYSNGELGRIRGSATPPATGQGRGLVGAYYDGLTLSGPAHNRLDKQVNFDWANGAPFPGFDGDTFSVRWTGQLLTRAAGTHTFTVRSDDGVRLFVNGKKLVDQWNDHSPREDSGSITLEQGQFYDLRLEYYENFGTAVVQLFWDGPGFGRQPIPTAYLYPYALVLTGEPPATAADAAVRDRLRANGLAPQLARGAGSAARDADGKALLLLSATVDPATVGARFRKTATPILVWESGLYDDLGMTGSGAGAAGTLGARTRLRITAPKHPLAAGLTAEVTVTGAPTPFSFGVPNANAIVVARQTAGARQPVLFAYERGAAMPGLVAPGRRVALFFGDTTAAALTPAGGKLFDAAVRWAVQ